MWGKLPLFRAELHGHQNRHKNTYLILNGTFNPFPANCVVQVAALRRTAIEFEAQDLPLPRGCALPFPSVRTTNIYI